MSCPPKRQTRNIPHRAPLVRLGSLCLLLFGLPLSLWAVPPLDADVAHAERTLKEAGLATDADSVLAFIRAHTLSEEEQERLAATVRQLGDGSYLVREQASRSLIAAGRPALPFLRAGTHDRDLEIAWRARRCIEEIQLSSTSVLMTAAARLVRDRRPQGAVATLLAYLPCIDEEAVEETWFDALEALGFQDGQPDPALVNALGDKRSIRRAAAAHILGQAAEGDVRRRVMPLLTDVDVRVRYEAAAALMRAGERAGVPVLTALLTDAPLQLACQSEHLLLWVADGEGPRTGLGIGDGPSRKKCRNAWETWWQIHQGRIDLARLKHEEPLRGLTVVCEYDSASGPGRVWEWGSDGKPRWEITNLEGPNDVQLLPGGRVLIAERNANRVTERDHHGNVLWQHRTAGNPIASQRLANGNTLICTFNELYEVNLEGKKVFTHSHRLGFRHAVKLRNGHVLYVTSQGQVVELDAAWKEEVRSIRPATYSAGASYWASVQPLPNGHFLLALGGASRVIEIDTDGKILWECTLPSAVYAARLRNGNTLVACFEGKCLVEVDPSGKEVSKQTLQGRPFTVRRY
jgi:HEAT repeat protein